MRRGEGGALWPASLPSGTVGREEKRWNVQNVT